MSNILFVWCECYFVSLQTLKYKEKHNYHLAWFNSQKRGVGAQHEAHSNTQNGAVLFFSKTCSRETTYRKGLYRAFVTKGFRYFPIHPTSSLVRWHWWKQKLCVVYNVLMITSSEVLNNNNKHNIHPANGIFDTFIILTSNFPYAVTCPFKWMI